MIGDRSSGIADNLPDEAAPIEDWSTSIQVSRWQAGDLTAFRALYNRFTQLIAKRVSRSPVWPALSGRMQLEDVVQEIWAQVIPSAQKAFTASGPGSFSAFLSQISDRKMVNLARIERATKRWNGTADEPLQQDQEQLAVQKPGLPVIETPTSRARCSELESIAREELSPREYDAWELVEIQKYTAEEAGVALRCTGSAVRGLLFRTRAKLLTRLGRK